MKFGTNQTLRLLIVFIIVLIGSGLFVYAILKTTADQKPQTGTVSQATPELSTSRPPAGEPIRESQRPTTNEHQTLFGRLFESRSPDTANASEGTGMTIVRISLRLLLAALLGAVLAFRPRKKLVAVRSNPYVAQTQILLAIVASALMMIVGDNAARAFGIFAAVSLVRFRTNIRDPKEISVLLISLALGLATGVGKPELAVILCAFVLIGLWILERFEPQLVFRSMDLRVVTKNIETTRGALKHVFAKHSFTSELRGVTRNGDERAGTIVNSVDVSPAMSTDDLSEEILLNDGGNITSIEWEQKKNFSYLYQ